MGATHIVAVEGVKDSGDVAAQDADGDAGVVQRHPAAAGLLRAVAAEQVVAHRAQQAQLRGGREGWRGDPGVREIFITLQDDDALWKAAVPLNISPPLRFAAGPACGPTAGRLLSSSSRAPIFWARLGSDVPVKASTRSH